MYSHCTTLLPVKPTISGSLRNCIVTSRIKGKPAIAIYSKTRGLHRRIKTPTISRSRTSPQRTPRFYHKTRVRQFFLPFARKLVKECGFVLLDTRRYVRANERAICHKFNSSLRMVYVPVPQGPGVVKTSNIDLCSAPCRHPPHHLMSANLRLRPRFNGMCPSGVPLCYMFSPPYEPDESSSDDTRVPFSTSNAGDGDLSTRAHANQDPAKATAFLKRPHRIQTMLSDCLFSLPLGQGTRRNIGHTFANPSNRIIARPT